MECEFDNTGMEGTPSTDWRHVSDKPSIQTKHKPQHFINSQRCCKIYIIRTCCHPVFPILFFFWVKLKHRFAFTMKYLLTLL
jgi:hypothetical protein